MAKDERVCPECGAEMTWNTWYEGWLCNNPHCLHLAMPEQEQAKEAKR
jgi:RNA polymerase subunit RPABC4/transcription elongation factor Spt4